MASPGTLTHVLEVARQVQAAAAAHAASITETASVAAPPARPATEAPSVAPGH